MTDLLTELTILEGRIVKLQETVRELQQHNTKGETPGSRSVTVPVPLRRRMIEWSGLLRFPMNVHRSISK